MLVLGADEMRAVDRATIDSGAASGPELMARAGRGVVDAIERRFGTVLALRALVLCGAGNNGGDGFVIARELAARGAHPTAVLVAPRANVRGDAAHHLAAMESAGIAAREPADAAGLRGVAGGAEWDLVVDAVLGTGSSGAPRGLAADACALANELGRGGARVVAVDLPTGVDATTGAAWDGAVSARLTVTFGALKRAHVLWPARACCGEIDVVDIGLADPAGLGYGQVRRSDAAAMGALVPRRDPRAHKGTAGRVLLVGGAAGTTGAIALAARGATRAGAGYVRVLAPRSLADLLAGKLTEEMVVAAGETAARALRVSALALARDEAAHAQAVALGPGLSRDPDAAALARALHAELPNALVLDADGLNAFEGRAGDLAAARAPRVLTPHPGELARLVGEPVAALEARRVDVAIECARRFGAVLVMKGAPTVTASPDGRAEINATGNPGMATAGMGDVLTGAIAALLAQGLEPFDAARLAVHAHGLAGDLAAAELGPIGLAAGDVAERLPRALALLAAAAAR